MNAIVYSEYGLPENLHWKDVNKPTPKSSEVLIKIHAASINSWDWDLLRGKPFVVRAMYGAFRKPKFQILGADIAGVVSAVGKDVKKLKTGDAVFGDLCADGWSGFAEFVCVPENVLTKKPKYLSFEQAASIPQAGVMALQSLFDKEAVKPGMKILINGAGGGVGTFAIQIAKYLEAEVTAVDNAMKLDLMKSLGADFVIDYMKEDFTNTGIHYDLIIDVVANRSILNYKRSLNKNGRFIMIGGTSSTILQTIFLGSLISLFGSKKLGILAHEPNKNLDKILKLIDSKKVRPIIDSVFPLEKVPEAFDHFGSGKVKGKIIIKIIE